MIANDLDILLVEDSAEDAELCIRVLKQEYPAARISVVTDGVEALDFLFCRGAFAERSFERPPKVILLDLKLPKLNGIEVLEQLKEDRRTRLIPVVLLTSSKERRDVLSCYDRGANAYVQKPVSFDQFRETLQTVAHFWVDVNQRPVFSDGGEPSC